VRNGVIATCIPRREIRGRKFNLSCNKDVKTMPQVAHAEKDFRIRHMDAFIRQGRLAGVRGRASLIASTDGPLR